MERRTFIKYAVSTLALQAVPGQLFAGGWAPDFSAIRLADTGMDAAQWRTIELVQAHLFPKEAKAPGAKDVNATAYLQWVLSDPGLEAEQRRFFGQGLELLERIAREVGSASFRLLDTDGREQALRTLEQDGTGRRWITELLHYIFEALLTDPVYGGNPKGIGWQWLKHQPGYRRPTLDKRYFLL